jgi:hypothetical protein
MAGQGRDNALDHVLVVVFENRSLDNVLGRLYGPGDGKTFEGVIGKDLTNSIPEWAEHGAERKLVPYTVATGIRAYAEQHNIQIEGLPADPNAEIPPEQAPHIIHNFLAIQFPLLHPAARGPVPRPDPGERQP